MSDCWVNIRFGVRNFQIGKWFKFIRLGVNPYLVENPPEKYLEVFEFFCFV